MPAENRTLAIVLLTTLTGWIGFSLPFPIFSHIFLNPEHGIVDPNMPETWRTALMGGALAIYPLGQVIGSPVLGRLSDRLGRKRVLVWSLWGTVFGSLVLAFGVAAGSVLLIYLGRLLSGFAEGSLAIAQSIAADISTSKTKARNFAYIGIAIDVGFIVGPLLGGLLSDPALHPVFNAALPFWTACLLFAINAVLVWTLLKEPAPVEASAVQQRGVLKTFLDRRMLPGFILSFLVFWAIMIFFDFFAVYFVQVFQTPPAELGIYTALISLPLIISGLVVGNVIARIGVCPTGIISVLLMGSGTLLFLGFDSIAGLVFPIIVICIGINFGQTATSVTVSDAAAEGEQGQAMGVYRAVTVAAGGFSALAGGFLAGYAPSYPFVTAILASLGAFGLLLMGTVFQTSRQRA